MLSESDMNFFYNKGGFNHSSRIGFIMKLIRTLRPLSEDEWRIWYLENIHDEDYLQSLAQEMRQTIPEEYEVSAEDCYAYICDVIFRRTFQGYSKENQALQLLRAEISPGITESPADWDTSYFIDFHAYSASGHLIGIQLKPETFYTGGYHKVVDIEGKMAAFRHAYHAVTYILTYQKAADDTIDFTDPAVIEQIKQEMNK